MQYDNLISAVRESAHIAEHDVADRAVRSTLTVLGQRVAGGQGANLAAQLPGDLGDMFPADAPGERFDLAEFYQRVAEQEGVTEAQARQHARATMAAVTVAVTDGEVDALTSQLPDEYADLMQSENVQHR